MVRPCLVPSPVPASENTEHGGFQEGKTKEGPGQGL